MHSKQIVTAGKKIGESDKVMIMVHGRGATAEDILSLAGHLQVDNYALLAPQATNYTWYPYSFLAPPAENEPWLSSALSLLQEIVNDLEASGVTSANTYFLGF